MLIATLCISVNIILDFIIILFPFFASHTVAKRIKNFQEIKNKVVLAYKDISYYINYLRCGCEDCIYVIDDGTSAMKALDH